MFDGITGVKALVLFILSICSEEIYIASTVFLLRKRKEQHDRSRLLAAGFISVVSVCNVCLAIELGMCILGSPQSVIKEMFLPVPLFGVFLFYMMLPSYLNEIFHPAASKVRRILGTLLVWFLMVVAYIACCFVFNGGTHTAVFCLKDIVENITKPDIFLRCVMTLMFVSASISVCFYRIEWKTSNANKTWMRALRALTVLLALGFIGGVSLRFFPVFVIYMLLLVSTCIVICVYEFRVRIPVPQMDVQQEEMANPASRFRELAHKLDAIMAVEDVWQNPDICVGEMCSLLGTNRDYLAHAIKELGFANFSDMVNSRRVEFIHDEILADPGVKLTDLFFIAGYRSRATATRCFQQKYGCAPSELVKR